MNSLRLLLQAAIVVLSIYLFSKGFEIKRNTRKQPETDTLRNRLLALVLVVLGFAIGLGTLYWMAGKTLIRQSFGH